MGKKIRQRQDHSQFREFRRLKIKPAERDPTMGAEPDRHKKHEDKKKKA
jgi:hypothetical protein